MQRPPKRMSISARTQGLLLVLGAVFLAGGCSPGGGPGPGAANGADAQGMTDGSSGSDAGDATSRRDGTGGDTGARWPDVDAASCGSYVQDGPHAVGVTTLTVDGTSVEIWYPAADGAGSGRSKASYDMRNWLPADERKKIPDEKAPTWEMDAYRDVAASGDGPFPLVLFSHGFGGYRMQSTFLTVHLASWGYVVASADHPGRDLAAVLEEDVSNQDGAPETIEKVWDELERRSDQGSGRFANLVDTSKVAVTGHSAGAGSVVQVAQNRTVQALAGYAGGPMQYSSPLQTSGEAYLMSAEKDDIVPPDRVKRVWDAIDANKRYLEIADAGHLAFSDICLIGRDRGGVLEIADRNGVDVPSLLKILGSDGCEDEQLPPELAWPMIQHLTTAHIRAALGEDANPVDLDAQTFECFDALVEEHARKRN